MKIKTVEYKTGYVVEVEIKDNTLQSSPFANEKDALNAESLLKTVANENKKPKESCNIDNVIFSFCPNCGCGKPQKTYDGYWCKMCKTEF